MKRIVIWALVLALLLPASALADLEVRFLDVGQGDCAVVLCDGEAMVIDGGPKDAADFVYSYIRNTLGLKHIDYVVSTHPHADHVSGLAAVLNAAPADLLLPPTLNWDSRAFSRMMEYARKAGTPAEIPGDGDTLRLGGATVTVLLCWPEAIKEGYTNDSSIVLRVDYEKTSFLFMGDAEEYAEIMLEQSGMNLKADVLKVGHHGSCYSTGDFFLRKVQPAYAVISVGKDNGYGHPHRSLLDRLAKAGAKILRTDELGTISMRSDGKTVFVD